MSREADNEAFVRIAQRWLRKLGLYQGREDGWGGPKTLEALEALVAARSADPTRTYPLAPNPWPVPDQRSLVAFYGQPGDATRLVRVTLPYPMVLAWDPDVPVTTTLCHRLVARSLVGVLESVRDHYRTREALEAARMHLFGGVVNVRKQRGGNAWSTHAWGIAIDLDPAQNGFRTSWPQQATMPLAVVQLFEAAGWKSGARAWGRDAMHFQATS